MARASFTVFLVFFLASGAAMIVYGLTTKDINNEKKYAKCPGLDVCDDAVFDNVFDNKTRIFTNECCRRIVDRGRRCFDEYVISYLSEDEKMPDDLRNPSIQFPKSKQIWDKCVSVVQHLGL